MAGGDPFNTSEHRFDRALSQMLNADTVAGKAGSLAKAAALSPSLMAERVIKPFMAAARFGRHWADLKYQE